ncbi:MAG: twin-arginine translocase subunit TatC [Planctomycetota bacterium]
MPTPRSQADRSRAEPPRLDQFDVMDGAIMPLGDHLEDLRRRLMLSILGLLPFFVIALLVSRPVLEFLLVPVRKALRESGLPPVIQSTGPIEVFSSYMRVALLITILAGSWWLLTQLWLFVRPGLYAAERRFVYILIPLSVVLTFLGVVFMYTVMLPVVLSFFITFGSTLGVPEYVPTGVPAGVAIPSMPVLMGDPPAPEPGQHWINLELREARFCLAIDENGVPQIAGTALTSGSGILQLYRLSEYVRLILMLALGFAIGFQMPVVVLLLGWAGLVEPAGLARVRKYVLMGCLVASAFLTPADPLSMMLLAGPLYVLYEFGLLLLRVLPAKTIAKEPSA